MATLEAKDAIIEETEVLLRMLVTVEPFLAAVSPEDGIAIINQFQTILIGMIKGYEQEFISHKTVMVYHPVRPIGRPA